MVSMQKQNDRFRDQEDDHHDEEAKHHSHEIEEDGERKEEASAFLLSASRSAHLRNEELFVMSRVHSFMKHDMEHKRRRRKRRQWKNRLLLFIALFAVALVAGIVAKRQTKQDALAASAAKGGGYVRPNTLFGHVHFTKTAGTEINGILAARYERVCGHKGYSYDSYQFNLRVQQAVQQKPHVASVDEAYGNDLIHQQYPNRNRGHIPEPIMKEIGWEDCDYISRETSWEEWLEFQNATMTKDWWPSDDYRLELHVPCRDTLDHFLSQCNFRRRTFDCQTTNLTWEIEQCIAYPEFFDRRLETLLRPTAEVKCFNPIPVEPYLEYMGQFLQSKRSPAPFVHRESNRPRNKSLECLWNDGAMAHKVKQLLRRNYDYYGWCHECTGTERDLLKD